MSERLELLFVATVLAKVWWYPQNTIALMPILNSPQNHSAASQPGQSLSSLPEST
jgi:hypothetical protein